LQNGPNGNQSHEQQQQQQQLRGSVCVDQKRQQRRRRRRRRIGTTTTPTRRLHGKPMETGLHASQLKMNEQHLAEYTCSLSRNSKPWHETMKQIARVHSFGCWKHMIWNNIFSHGFCWSEFGCWWRQKLKRDQRNNQTTKQQQ
jgi:hypothetical protein